MKIKKNIPNLQSIHSFYFLSFIHFLKLWSSSKWNWTSKPKYKTLTSLLKHSITLLRFFFFLLIFKRLLIQKMKKKKRKKYLKLSPGKKEKNIDLIPISLDIFYFSFPTFAHNWFEYFCSFSICSKNSVTKERIGL